MYFSKNNFKNLQKKEIEVDTSLNSQIFTKVKKVSADVEAKRKQERDSILRQSVANSKNKGNTCEDMLADYEKAVKAFVANMDDEGAYTRLLEFRKDTPFNLCKQNVTFMEKVNTIDALMDEEE